MRHCCLVILLFFAAIPPLLFGQSSFDSLAKELQTHFERSDLPGFAVAIVKPEGPIFLRGFGLADIEGEIAFTPETILNWGSVSKTVTGLAVVKAVQAGSLRLDDDVDAWVPFTLRHPRYPNDTIIIRHLVNHTSGVLDSRYYGRAYVPAGNPDGEGNYHGGYAAFINGHSPVDLATFLKRILQRGEVWYKKKNFTKWAPGSTKEYANLNAALAALVVEEATETSFSDFTERHIFTPLSMSNTGWITAAKDRSGWAKQYFPAGEKVPPYRLITYPDGGLYSSVSDMSLFLVEIMRAYGGRSDYLPPRFAGMLLPGDEDDMRAFWGMGSESRNIGHGGSDPGVQADLQFNADSRIGRIILCNVNAEDDGTLYEQYRKIHTILARYEGRL